MILSDDGKQKDFETSRAIYTFTRPGVKASITREQTTPGYHSAILTAQYQDDS